MLRRCLIAGLLILGIFARISRAQWSAAQPVWNTSDPAEVNSASGIKDPRVAGSPGGGFHLAYRLFINGGNVENRYRRYSNGVMGPIRVMQSGNFTANTWLAEANNGDVHVAWENFDGFLDIAWVRSTDGGVTFSPAIDISNCGCDSTKFPGLAALGTGSNADMILAFADVSSNHQMKYQRWNGTAWTPAAAQSFASCDSEYFATGICTSLQDGSVYRSYGRKVSSNPSMYGLFYRRYDGSTWGPEQTVATTTFYAYPYIAVNPIGQIMLVWEQDNRIDSRWYTPGTGWSAVTTVDSNGNHGQVTAIPGTNHFYVVHSTSQQIVEGRYWINGQWLPKVTVSVGQPNNGSTFDPTARVTASGTRELAASWENWDTGNARGYYSVMNQPQIILLPNTISRTIYIGSNPASEAFLLTNGGPGTINYTIGSNTTWVTPSVSSGSTSGEDDIVTLTYNTQTLHRGVYTANITVSGNAPNSPKILPVQVTVQSVQTDFDGDGDVDQSDFAHLQTCLSGNAVLPVLPDCADAMLDGDFDVDNLDAAIFFGCISGADIPASAACMP